MTLDEKMNELNDNFVLFVTASMRMSNPHEAINYWAAQYHFRLRNSDSITAYEVATRDTMAYVQSKLKQSVEAYDDTRKSSR